MPERLLGLNFSNMVPLRDSKRMMPQRGCCMLLLVLVQLLQQYIESTSMLWLCCMTDNSALLWSIGATISFRV